MLRFSSITAFAWLPRVVARASAEVSGLTALRTDLEEHGAEEYHQYRLLKVVSDAIRWTSAVNCCTSWLIAVRSRPCGVVKARQFPKMRCRLPPITSRAPSAVWAEDTVFGELLGGTTMLEDDARRWRRPAASSRALLMRRPVDRRSIEVLSEFACPSCFAGPLGITFGVD